MQTQRDLHHIPMTDTRIQRGTDRQTDRHGIGFPKDRRPESQAERQTGNQTHQIDRQVGSQTQTKVKSGSHRDQL